MSQPSRTVPPSIIPTPPGDDTLQPSVSPSDHRTDGNRGTDNAIPNTLAPVPQTRHTDEEALSLGPLAIGQVDRYPIFGELGRGGMGAVLRGRDPVLNRDLAVKVLLGDYASVPAAVKRFEIEAQIGGRLQHPGVVPVYELGRAVQGRQPYFTMKLVEGSSLDTLLRQRPNPGHDLPRFLKIFEQVCQAIAYAHDQKIIHRDLKPSNIMVGAFGEVQVMDWGLAKEIREAAAASNSETPEQLHSSILQPASSNIHHADRTRAGAVLGTPAFMPPEQARGEIDVLDERSDVFGLGGILCVILTGGPVYMAPDLMQKAQQGDVAECFERLSNCGADLELIELAGHCLAPDRAARLADGKAVANAITSYLAGVQERLKRVELERAAAEARAAEERAKLLAERRARRMTLGLGAAVVLLLAIGGWVLRQRELQTLHEQERQARIDRDLQIAVEQVQGELELAWKSNDLRKLADSRAAASKLVDLALKSEASDEGKSAADDLLALAERRTTQAEKNNVLLAALLDGLHDDEYVGMKTEDVGQEQLVAQTEKDPTKRAFQAWGVNIDPAIPVVELAAHFQDQPEAVVQEIVSGLDEWYLKVFRSPQRQDAKTWQHLRDLADALDRSTLRRDVRRLSLDDQSQRDRARLYLTQEMMPWAATLAPELVSPRVAQLREMARQVDPMRESALGVVSLGRALNAAGDTQGAYDLVRRAHSHRPGEVQLNLTLVDLLKDQGRRSSPEVIERYQAARAARPELGVKLAFLLLEAKRVAEGETILRDLLRRRPASSELQQFLGRYLGLAGQFEEAERLLRLAISQSNPNEHVKAILVWVLLEHNRCEDCLSVCQEILAGRYEDQSYVHNCIGMACAKLNRHAEAAAAFRQALKLQPDLAISHDKLIRSLVTLQRYDEVLQACKEYARIRPAHVTILLQQAYALKGLQRLAEAAELLERVVASEPQYAEALYALGNVNHSLKRWRQATDAYRTYTQLHPEDADGHNNLGGALYHLKQYDDALRALAEALRINPQHLHAHANRGASLQAQGKLTDALASCKKALEIDPYFPEGHHYLGRVQRDMKEREAALASYRQAVTLNPKLYDAYRDYCDLLLQMKKLEDLVTLLRQAKEQFPKDSRIANEVRIYERLLLVEQQLVAYRAGKTRPADAVQWTDLARHCANFHQDNKSAVTFFREAIAAEKKPASMLFDEASQVALLAIYFEKLPPPAAEQLALRKQALAWMQSCLQLFTEEAKQPNSIAALRVVVDVWLTGKTYEAVRDEQGLAALPVDERKDWQKLWADVAALQKKIGKPE